ncbi:DUF2627 family protein [Virgibacillus halophilus]|uniref:DUF2627 family protein n=1 Tax=Tigheibacillus halophilus TaxID=361280 RepID=A0ABU5CCB0_9BACI|nr:DUF2627 family protein [Virgibacillus halophilus]
MARIIAFLILLLPGVFSAIGIKLIRDALFNDYYLLFFNAGIQFIIGCILFIGGIGFYWRIHFLQRSQNASNQKKRKTVQPKPITHYKQMSAISPVCSFIFCTDNTLLYVFML